MLALISLLAVIVGCINWLTIGLLQFDFVAGLFGSQSNIFSRIIYVIIGVGALILTVNIIKNKGRIAFNFRKLSPSVHPTPVPQESSKDFSKDNYQYHETQHNNYAQHSPQHYNHNEFMNESSKDYHKNELRSLSKQLNDRHNYNKNLQDR